MASVPVFVTEKVHLADFSTNSTVCRIIIELIAHSVIMALSTTQKNKIKELKEKREVVGLMPTLPFMLQVKKGESPFKKVLYISSKVKMNSDFMPVGWAWAYDDSAPTNRSNDKPFVIGENTTTCLDYYLVSPNVNILDVVFPGNKIKKSVLKDVQVDPITDEPVHVDLMGINLKEKIRLKIPVLLKGTPVGVKDQGGVLVHPTREIEVEGLPLDLPEHVEIDISDLSIGDSVTVANLESDKYVFVEKPLAENSERARKLVELAEKKNLVLLLVTFTGSTIL